MNLERIGVLKPFIPTEMPAAPPAPGAFAEALLNIRAGEEATRHLALGDAGALHTSMLALEKAKLSMEMLVGVRNRLMSAWQELMREQI